MYVPFTGTGTAGGLGDGSAASSAQLNYPQALCFDSLGNAYIADQSNQLIRKVMASTGAIKTIAGTTQSEWAQILLLSNA